MILRCLLLFLAVFAFSAEFVAARTTTGQQSTALSTFRQTQPGETFYHYGYTQHAAGFQGGLRPGGFATANSGLTGSAAQQGLALPHATPPNAMYIIRPAPGTPVRVNPVTRPDFGQPGGLPEFQFPMGTTPGSASGPIPIR